MSTAYLEAIRYALEHSMRDDPRVFIYGQDVEDPFGGAFKATKGLSSAFPGRVFNAPISEDAITAVGIGAAIEGMRPVLEFQFADFATIAFNQLVNHAATYYWRTGIHCPILARLPCGGTPGGGPFHSQMPETWLSNHPGLIVLAPATVSDAYGMLRQGIACNDPVIFLEHKHLYYHLRDDRFQAEAPAEVAPLGAAVVRRDGTDCTLVSYSRMLHESLTAAEILEREHGISVEVLDLRCLRPLDTDTILASVARTGRIVVATESWPFAGIPAEILALVADEGFHLLDAPPQRIAARDTPIPFHPKLFAAHHPDAQRIAGAVLNTVRF